MNAPPAQNYPPPGNHAQAKPPQVPTQQPFVDPAILSFSKPPSQVNGPAEAMYNTNETQPEKPTVAAALTEPFSNLGIHIPSKGTTSQAVSYENELEGSVPLVGQTTETSSTALKPTGKKNRRGGRSKIQKDTFQGLSPVNEHDGASNTNPKTKGWRQTAFVEPSNPMELHSPESYRGKTAKLNTRRRKKQKQNSHAEPNGWATEDATDIQELGEFDFQSNLSKFDKRRVFEEIRNDDTTADEDRLASFNRKVPKPGTQGGKNLHWSENVLDSPQNSEVWYSDADASDENGHLSNRDLSRASTRARSSRKGSAMAAQSLLASQVNPMSRNQLNSSRTTSPRPGKTSTSGLSSTSPLRLLTTNRSCPVVSPLQALEIEQIAIAEFGLTEEVISENAGRGIAEAAVNRLTDESTSLSILLFIGNHRTGSRTIAAARHLRNRGYRVTVCMLGLEHESELLESCRRQLEMFKKSGGRLARWAELSARLSTTAADLIVDALFGIHIAFNDLRTDEQAIAFEMIAWVNRAGIEVLSVDVPSGLSASSGMNL